ncbi:MAG: MBL fold metallo-hydrolase [Candidatus Hodarchaeota archaeon]
MDPNPIVTTSGKFTDEIILVDLYTYSFNKLGTAFILETPECFSIIDCGTSNSVRNLIKFLKEQIPLEKVKYLIPSHFHFDHFGGGWKLWKKIHEVNPDVKVLTTQTSKELLQDPEPHMKRAERMFGGLIGVMKSIPDEAFEIIEPDTPLSIPGLDGSRQFKLVSTPGHTPDHVSPTLFENGEAKFTFLGETAGALLHSSKILTLGSSMPPDFIFDTYMKSLNKLIELKPKNVGYCHFGGIKGQDHVMEALLGHEEYAQDFKEYVKKRYEESGRVKFIVDEYMEEEVPKRTDWEHIELLRNIVIGIVYGQLIDLGLKPRD